MGKENEGARSVPAGGAGRMVAAGGGFSPPAGGVNPLFPLGVNFPVSF